MSSTTTLNPVAIVHKANQRAPLSPGQRALLKILKEVGYFLITTGFAQAPQLVQAIQGHNINVTTALISQLVAAVLQIILTGVDKYQSAQGDSQYTIVKNTLLETLLTFYKQNGPGAIASPVAPVAPATSAEAPVAAPTAPTLEPAAASAPTA